MQAQELVQRVSASTVLIRERGELTGVWAAWRDAFGQVRDRAHIILFGPSRDGHAEDRAAVQIRRIRIVKRLPGSGTPDPG